MSCCTTTWLCQAHRFERGLCASCCKPATKVESELLHPDGVYRPCALICEACCDQIQREGTPGT